MDAAGVTKAGRSVASRGLTNAVRGVLDAQPPPHVESPLWIDDLAAAADDPLVAALARAAEGSVGAVAVVALAHRGVPVGQLWIARRAAGPADDRLRRLVDTIAAQTAAAIARLDGDGEGRLAEVLSTTADFSDLFVALVGHDLRNPLSAIINTAELVRMIGGGDADRIADRLLRAATRMSRMIDQVLDVTRIRLGSGIPVAPAFADLGELCSVAIEELRESRADVHIDLRMSGNRTAWCDPDRVAQLVVHLLGNAIDHGTAGQPVVARIEAEGRDVVRLVIENFGAIPGEALEQITDPLRFRRKKGPKAAGLGLGIYVGRHVALAQGGDLEITSDAAGLTRVAVTLRRTAPAAG
jgi:signal transduction histidine kinase